MTRNRYDVIIVGARIAGVMAAGLLARYGYSSLIVDQAQFPKDTVSAPVVHGNALQLLDGIGAGKAVDACGFPRIRCIRRVGLDQTIKGHLLPIGGRDYSLGVSRLRLDIELLKHLRRCPDVTIREGFTVRSLIYDGHCVVGIEGYQGDRYVQPERFYSSLVIGADGINSFVARQVKAETYRADPPQFFQYYAFFADFAQADDVEMALFSLPGGQSMLVFPVEDQLTALSWSVPVSQLSSIRGRVPLEFQRAWQSHPELRMRGRHAAQATKMKGRLPIPSFFRQPWGDGWALIGDASFHTDPSGGRGFYDACRSAELLVHAFDQSRRGRSWQEAMRLFQITRDLEFDVSYRYIRMLGGDTSISFPGYHQLQQTACDNQVTADILLSLNKSVPLSLLMDATCLDALPFSRPHAS